MSSICQCPCCNFEIYVGEFTQNKFYTIKTKDYSSLKDFCNSFVEKYRQIDDTYIIDESIRFITQKAIDCFFVKCPSCKSLHFYNKKWSNYVGTYSLDTVDGIPIINNPENKLPSNCREIYSLSERYLNNTQLKNKATLNCNCGKKNAFVNTLFYFDYYIFSSVLLDSLGELEEENPKYSNLSASDALKYLNLIAYHGTVCSKCKKFLIYGKNEKNSSFFAIYAKHIFPDI